MIEWSKSWNKSKKPKKQRKYIFNAPLHIKHKLMGANLSEDLRKKHGKRSIAVRKGDKVKVMRGKFKGTTGAVDRVDIKNSVVYVTGAEITKRDGSKVTPPIHASNLMIIELNLNDKRRESKLKTKPEGKKNA